MRRAHHVALLALTALAPAWIVASARQPAAARGAAAPAPFTVSPNGEYLIQFTPRAAQQSVAERQLRADGIEAIEIADNLAISLATLTPGEVADVASTPGVIAITPNADMHAATTQPNPPWGLDRIDQTDLPLSNSFTYSSSAGAGTTIYVLDSGINSAHVEFAGRLLAGTNTIDNSGSTDDCGGHGTHVAGIAGGTTYGIAKLADLVPVRVLDCSGDGSVASVLAGINWVLGQHTTGRAIANLSLGSTSPVPMIDNAVAALLADGVAVVVAAGNGGTDVCNSSPAAAPGALTVGNSTRLDARAATSNFGTCLDLFAPGTEILSTWRDTPTATNIQSGTSMASPHVAGALALLWTDNPTLTATEAQALLVARSVPDRLSGIGIGSPNRLLHLSPPLDRIVGPAAAAWPAERCSLTPLC